MPTDRLKERWYPAVNGTGARPWFLTRENTGPTGKQYAENVKGQLRRFKSQASAQREADFMNYQRGGAMR